MATKHSDVKPGSLRIGDIALRKMTEFNEPDIELLVGGELVKANKYTLMIHSKTFRTLFQGGFNKDGPYKLDHDPKVFSTLVSLLQNHELPDLDLIELLLLMNLANYYNMTEMYEMMESLLFTESMVNEQNVYDVYLTLNSEESKRRCVDKMCSYVEACKEDLLSAETCANVKNMFGKITQEDILLFHEIYNSQSHKERATHKEENDTLVALMLMWYTVHLGKRGPLADDMGIEHQGKQKEKEKENEKENEQENTAIKNLLKKAINSIDLSNSSVSDIMDFYIFTFELGVFDDDKILKDLVFARKQEKKKEQNMFTKN